jgi:hypothetical protein
MISLNDTSVEKVAEHFNTALRRLAAFPLRVLYRYALLGHRKPMDVKKPLIYRARNPLNVVC